LSGNITVADGVVATINSDLAAETENHSLRKLGAGTLIVNGDAGQLVVKAGVLGGSGAIDHLTIRAGGTVNPGDLAPTSLAGVMTVTDSFTMETGSRLSIDIRSKDNDDPQYPEFDQLLVGGAAKLAGTLSVNLFGDAAELNAPEDGDSFTIIAADNITGRFDHLELPELATGLVWKPVYDATSFSLLVAPRLPGDYDNSGVVGARDYIIWRQTHGQTGGMLAADASGPDGIPDGIVDDYDLGAWRENFGNRAVTPAATAANVPEPTATGFVLSLIAAGATSCGRRLRRRFRS
jgi:hypothetical protein